MVRCQNFSPSGRRPSGNRINFSSMYEAQLSDYAVPTVGIKYALQGTENYVLDRKRFPVSPGRFLVVNAQRPLDIFIRSRQPVDVLCIHLNAALVADAWRASNREDDQLLEDVAPADPLPAFEELLYGEEDNELGRCLGRMALHFDRESECIDLEADALYQELAAALARTVYPATAPMGVVRSSTRTELLRRLELGRQLLDSADPGVDMTTVARESLLSPAHFFRSFRKAFGCTPYQYLQSRRLREAAALIRSGEMRPTEAAVHSGFADLAGFSKAFRKQFGLPPSKWGSAQV